jgi:hypothetical protein
MLEIILFLSIAILILLFFYKQSVEEYRLNQISFSQISTLPALLAEKSPIVVLDTPQIPFWNSADLKSRPALAAGRLVNGLAIGDAVHLNVEELKPHFLYNKSQAALLGEKTGAPVWVQNKWLHHIVPSTLQWATLPSCRAWFGSRGLQSTTAPWTLVTVSEGTAQVSLLHKKYDTYLPSRWKNRLPTEFSPADTPFLGDIGYIDVILRPGTTLLVPAHWKMSWIATATAAQAEAQPTQAFILETAFHHQLSRLVEMIDDKRT